MTTLLVALIPALAAVLVALLGIVQIKVQTRSTSALSAAQEAVARKEDLLDDQDRRIRNLEDDRAREARRRQEEAEKAEKCQEELADVKRRLDALEAPSE